MVFGKEEAKTKIIEFVNSRQARKLDDINEENTKNHLDDLFRILGWDISMDTVKEESAGRRKRVDYSFKIDGATKFLLEAKAYGKNLDDHVKQALNYAYQQNKKWVVLSNLREIRIYNAQYYDKDEEIRRLFSPLKIEEFVNRFDDLWLLSKEAFTNNAIDEYAKKMSKIRPTEPIDHKLYEDLMRWRSLLTKSINSHPRINALSLDSEEASAKIDEAVQKILDRIIFIRVAEDRGLENERSLEAVVRRWKDNKKQDIYLYLKEFFRKMDDTYNSGLFAPHYSEDLGIDNEVLEAVIGEIYKSKDKTLDYDFSAINADILGAAYEQYLGTLLRKTAKRTSLKSSKAKRKEMGIYYTPIYIVDYIVKNTLGEKLKECNKPDDVLKLRVLDPACGSGSFLIRAYDEFERWYKEYITKNSKARQTTLDLDSKKGVQTFMDRVLENCIYGVDLDPKAVEMAQLNLLLKAAEGRHKLPKLEHNIQCGNSLIDDPTVAGKYEFKWKDRFSEVFVQGGFDVVIGNPPYGAKFSEQEKEYFKHTFSSAIGRYDSYHYFIEQSIILLRNTGLLGLIIPDTWLTNHQTQKLRDKILANCCVGEILGLPQDVFAEATIDACIITMKKQLNEEIRKKNDVNIHLLNKKATENDLINRKFDTTFVTKQTKWMVDERKLFNIYLSSSDMTDKYRKDSIHLGEITDMCRGINPYAKSELIEKYGSVKGTEIVEKRIWHSYEKRSEEYKKELVGGDIGRYSLCWTSGQWIKYGNQLSRARDPRFFTTPHLVVQRIRNPSLKMRLVATFIDPSEEYYNNSGLTNIIISNPDYSIKYILAIINSKAMNWYYRQFFRDVNIKPEDLRQLPIKNFDLKKQQPLIELVEKMLTLNKRLQGLGENTNEGARVKEEIKKIDAEIDELVYKIYGINEEEKKIIEDALK